MGAVAVGVAGGVVRLGRGAVRVGQVGVEERPGRRSACCCRRTRRSPGSAGCRRSRRSAACRRPSAAARARLPWSANDGCSGHAPVSSTPKMTPLPALRLPPSCGYSVGAPMKSGLESVSGWRSASCCTATTPGIASDRRDLVGRHGRRHAAVHGAQRWPTCGLRHGLRQLGDERGLLRRRRSPRSAARPASRRTASSPGDRRAGRGEPGDAARVGGDRVVVELDRSTSPAWRRCGRAAPGRSGPAGSSAPWSLRPARSAHRLCGEVGRRLLSRAEHRRPRRRTAPTPPSPQGA